MSTITINTTLSDRPTLDVTADSELMQNHQAALPVGPEQDLVAVYDSDGNPIVLSFSPDGDFYAIVHAPGTRTAWQQIDLSAALEPFGQTRSFAAGQLPGGNIFLAVAVQDINDPTTQNLFIAGPLSSDLTQTNWASLGSSWTKSPNKVTGSSVARLFVGPADDGQGFGVPMIAVSVSTPGASGLTEYIVQASVDTQSGLITWNWVDFPTPTEATQIIDYALGTVSDLGTGVYVLYEGTGAQPMLVFKTFLNQLGRDFVRELTVPAGAATLQTTPGQGSAATTNLFVGGTAGVFWFSPANQQTMAVAAAIASQADVPDVTTGGLIVRQDQTQNGTIAVWALSGESLYYLHSQSDGTWSTPVLFRQNVARIAPLRNQQKFANELIYIGTDLDTSPNVYYMWQDPGTTLWKQDYIPLEDTGQVLDVNSYTTHINFRDARGYPASDQTFNVTSDSWLRVVINGVTYIVDADVPAAVQPDLQGNITIINSVQDLATPLLHVTSACFAGTLDVDPAHKVNQTLSQVQSPSDIPVLPQTLPSGINATDVSSAVQGLMQFHPSTGGEPADVIVFRPAAAAAPAKLNTSAAQGSQTFALAFAGGGFQFHDAAAVAAMPNLQAMTQSVGDALSDFGGDIIEFLKNVTDKVEHFIVTTVQGAVHFIVNVGAQVVQFAITSFEEVYKALSWVFNKLKIAFQDLIKWLGFLFEWDDILTTHRVFVNLVNQAFNYGQSKLVGIEDAVAAFFDDLEAKIKALEPLGGTTGSTGLKAGAANVKSSLPSSSEPAFNFGTNSPGGNYGNYHLMHSGVLDYTSPAGNGVSDPFTAFLNDVLIPTFDSVKDSAEQVITDIRQGYENGTMTLDQVIARISGDVIIGILDAIKTVVVGIIKFFGDLLALFQSAINDPVEIPFLSGLYLKFVGSQMSVLDGLMLLFAIPATVVYKLAAGKAPFADSTYGMDTRNYTDLLAQIPAPPPVAAATAAAVVRAPVKTLEAAGDGSSSSTGTSNQVSTCAKVYSDLGGFVALLTGTAYDLMSLAAAVATAQANQEEQDSGQTDNVKKLKASVSTISKIQVGLAMANIAGSYPVAPGPEQSIQIGYWGMSWADLIKSGIAVELEDQQLAQKIIGVYEIPEGVVDLALAIAILVKQMEDDDNSQKGMDVFSFFPNLLNAVGTSVGGATRIDQDKESQSILAIISGGCYAVGGVLDFVILCVEVVDGMAHN